MDNLPVIEFANQSLSYDHLPKRVFGNSIFDIGCMSGLNSLISKHREEFLRCEREDNYLGVDVLPPSRTYLRPIIKQNILDFNTDMKFDLVLALHVIEHIPYHNWKRLFEKLISFVAERGFLVIEVPYNEQPRKQVMQYDHVTFNITEETFRKFLPDIELMKYYAPYTHWKEESENHLWAFARFIYRRLTNHPYSKIHQNIQMIWSNDNGD